MGAYCVEYDLKTKYFVLLKHEIEKQLLTLFLQQDFQLNSFSWWSLKEAYGSRFYFPFWEVAKYLPQTLTELVGVLSWQHAKIKKYQKKNVRNKSRNAWKQEKCKMYAGTKRTKSAFHCNCLIVTSPTEWYRMTTTNRLLAREKNSDGLRKLEAETVFLPPGPLSRIGLVLRG